ncbi:interferon gamma-like [Pempheris klunzingeri]|uniref:interferon gamma-like n=1 Tax=Pempheris klunzingeri TaxID=3127111 RepID=UPI0039813D75
MMVAAARAVVCLSLWLSVCQVRGSHIPVRMNRTIQNLLQYYTITPKERFDGKPVFSREPLSGRTEVKMIFMGAVLETYEKLIGQMLKNLPTASPQTVGSTDRPGTAGVAEGETVKDVRTELSYVLKRVQDLRRQDYQEEEKVLQGLLSLKHIKMDNAVIQSKALWELPWLYEEASSLPNTIRMQKQMRRRRRHARRVKNHPRA